MGAFIPKPITTLFSKEEAGQLSLPPKNNFIFFVTLFLFNTLNLLNLDSK
jgi:hypothetical protein